MRKMFGEVLSGTTYKAEKQKQVQAGGKLIKKLNKKLNK